MNLIARMSWIAAFSAGLSFAACGDDDTPSDAGRDAHDHEHEDGGDHDDEDDAGAAAKMSFFVTSDTNSTGDLGGLTGADARCNRLAAAAGVRNPKFAAYLSAEKNEDGEDEPIHARDRIGNGPWYNAKGTLLARDLDALHALKGDAELFLDEKGNKINGQWEGSPTPNQHDILTGTKADGTVMPGMTCADWTSSDASLKAQVGHSDGLGPNRDATAPRNSWNSAHENQDCSNTTPRGGAGKIYCFSTE